MNSTDVLPTRLAHLRASARLMAATSPTTSAFLGAQYNKILSETKYDTEENSEHRDARQREICGGCGMAMIPGLTCTTRHTANLGRSKKGKVTKKAVEKESKEKHIVLTCARCHARTIQKIPVQAIVSDRAYRLAARVAARPEPEPPVLPSPTPARGSKKRAKARKQGGLQAMMAKTKPAETSSGFGLDLMDLMKST